MLPSYNLRYQYLMVVIVTSIILVIVIITANNYVRIVNEKNINNSSLRVTISGTVKTLHHRIDRANQLLNLFLLSPTKRYRREFNIEIKKALRMTERLTNNEWINTNALENEVADIKSNIDKLLKTSQNLIALRANNYGIYPGIAVAEERMLTAQTQFIKEINLAILEVRETEPFDLELYDDFILIRDKWRRLTLAFRLNVINQLGELKQKTLNLTEQNINLYSSEILNSLNTTFHNYNNSGSLGFQSEISVKAMKVNIKLWISAFRDVQNITNQGTWRLDIAIIRDHINPIKDDIYYSLEQLELSLNLASSNDLRIQQKTSETISNYLWLIIIVFILIVSIIYFVIDRSLLKPIELLTLSISNNEDLEVTKKLIKNQSIEISNFVSAFSNMKHQVLSREQELTYMALHDSLTSIANRTLMFDRINVAINNYQRYKKLFALIMLDLNKFKEVNDNLGHQFGDEVLIQVASRLKSILRKTDSVARIGGDEFAILMLNIEHTAIKELANKINFKVGEPFFIKGHKIIIGTSIGVAIFPNHGFNNEMLMQKADIAMYYSKKNQTHFTIYSDDLSKPNSNSSDYLKLR